MSSAAAACLAYRRRGDGRHHVGIMRPLRHFDPARPSRPVVRGVHTCRSRPPANTTWTAASSLRASRN